MGDLIYYIIKRSIGLYLYDQVWQVFPHLMSVLKQFEEYVKNCAEVLSQPGTTLAFIQKGDAMKFELIPGEQLNNMLVRPLHKRANK